MRWANGSASPFLAAGKARGWIKARGTHRTASTHGLAAIRTRHRLACLLEALHEVLHPRSAVAPAWGQQHVPLAWDARNGLRSDQARLPKDASTRESRTRPIGADGSQLLEGVRAADPALGVRELPALEALRQIGRHHYDRCPVPGREALRWRTGDEPPPAARRLASPYDLAARYSRKRDTPGGGSKVHLTETCDANQPDLITPVLTTPATTPDGGMGPAIPRDLAQRDLLPGTP
jgi:transposase